MSRDLLDEAKDYHLMPERRNLVPSFRTRSRIFEHPFGHIYAVGGLTKNGIKNKLSHKNSKE